jgi:hypothetical protein
MHGSVQNISNTYHDMLISSLQRERLPMVHSKMYFCAAGVGSQRALVTPMKPQFF